MTTKEVTTSKRAARAGKTPTTRRAARAGKTPRRGARKALLSKSGTPITDALAEQLADEAERGYDLSLGRRVGRPSLAGRGVSPRVNFRTTPRLHERARRRAAKEGKTISELAREALERYIG
jgi:hypothetical protein